MRLIDADALLSHQIEADRMGAMLVVRIGHILRAPTIDALKPQPDAETGLVPCGCGCEVSVTCFGDYGEQEIFQVTSECGLGTGFEYTKDSVVNVWNKAMGWKG